MFVMFDRASKPLISPGDRESSGSEVDKEPEAWKARRVLYVRGRVDVTACGFLNLFIRLRFGDIQLRRRRSVLRWSYV